MADKNEFKGAERMAWSAPEFRRLRAGAAEENGSNNIPDGGPTGNARS